MPSPKLVPLNLTDDERRTLTAWSRRRKTAQALADRSRVILACDAGGSNSAVAADLGVSRDMVSKWRSRFLQSRLAGLTDEPRPGRPRLIGDEQVEAVIAATLEQAPARGDTHWSTRSMARSQGMSQSAVSRIWRAFGLKPHLVETWKLSTDPQFIDKVRDVVGLYMSPPENALVLCVDEKSQIQAYPGDDSGVRDGRQQTALSVSPSVADGLSGGRPRRGQPTREPIPPRPLVDAPFALTITDAYARVRPAATRYLIFVTPDNQALDRSQPVLPMMPGMPERRTHDYARHGVTSLFAAFNIEDGTVISELHRRHRHQEFLKFLKRIDKNVPAGLDVHLVCDNYGTHKTPVIQDWLARHPRFHVHFTPTGSSWINQVPVNRPSAWRHARVS